MRCVKLGSLDVNGWVLVNMSFGDLLNGRKLCRPPLLLIYQSPVILLNKVSNLNDSENPQ